MKRLFYMLRYCLIFTRELVLANYEVTKLVLTPELKIQPGFIAVPMDAESDLEVTSLANSITLTPGTITVHLPEGRNVIVVHALNVTEDPEGVRRAIKEELEANILKFTRIQGAAA
jgi:multicomponent Na+:H+ antiporter subunit E